MRRHREQALLAKARVIDARREKEEAANTKPEERPTGLFAELAKKEPVRKHSPTPGPATMSCTFCWEGFGPVLAARAAASTTAVSRTDLDWVSVLQLETRLAVEVYGVQHLLRMLIAKPELRAVAPTGADHQATKVRHSAQAALTALHMSLFC